VHLRSTARNGTVKSLDQLNTGVAGQQHDCDARLDRQADDLGQRTTMPRRPWVGTKGGAIGGTLTSSSTFTAAAAPVADAVAASTRAGLV
jgi:hypothetical protein